MGDVAHGVVTPRALPRLRAAAYVMMNPEEFDLMVRMGHLPKPHDIDGCQVWDRILLATNRKVNPAALFMVFPASSLERRRRSLETARDKARFDNASGVYVVSFETFAKIGFSKKIGKRIRHLEEHLPTDLNIRAIIHAATLQDEKILHRRFDHLRLIREWFRFGPEMEDFVSSVGEPKTADNIQPEEIAAALRRVRR